MSALIPDEEMDALSDVTRETPLRATFSNSVREKKVISTSPNKKAKGPQDATSERVEKMGKVRDDTPSSSSPSSSLGKKARKADEAQEPARLDSSNSSALRDDSVDSFSVAVEAIVANPFQPRRIFNEDELAELAASIKLHGILQPVLLRPFTGGSEGHYQLVAGERRWRAAQRAGLKEIPAIVRPMADQQALELALIENVQRHDISAVDAAIAYRRLADEFMLSQEQIARRVGKSRSAVANTMRLLDLPEEARKAIENGDISEGHGRALLLASGEGARRALLRRVLRDKISVREAENMARSFIDESQSERKPRGDVQTTTATKNEDWTQAEQNCTKKLGVRVKVKSSKRRNAIAIECGTITEMERVLALLQDKL